MNSSAETIATLVAARVTALERASARLAARESSSPLVRLARATFHVDNANSVLTRDLHLHERLARTALQLATTLGALVTAREPLATRLQTVLPLGLSVASHEHRVSAFVAVVAGGYRLLHQNPAHVVALALV